MKRAPALRNNLLGGLLSREFGRHFERTGREKLVAEALVGRWEARQVLESEGIDISEFGSANRSPSSITDFEWDPYTHGLFYGASRSRLIGMDEGAGVRHWGESFFEYDRSARFPREPLEGIHPIYNIQNRCTLSFGDDAFSSIKLEPSSRMILATWLAPSTGHNAFLRKFCGPDRGSEEGIYALPVTPYSDPLLYTYLVSVRFLLMLHSDNHLPHRLSHSHRPFHHPLDIDGRSPFFSIRICHRYHARHLHYPQRYP